MAHAVPHATAHTWKVTITMADGSRGRHFGVYPNGAAAILRAMEWFPTACCISAKRLVPAVQQAHHPHTHHPERRA